jgi:hypothetical protein
LEVCAVAGGAKARTEKNMNSGQGWAMPWAEWANINSRLWAGPWARGRGQQRPWAGPRLEALTLLLLDVHEFSDKVFQLCHALAHGGL